MPQYVVTYQSMVIEADTPEDAITKAEDSSGGGHWEAVEVDLSDLTPALTSHELPPDPTYVRSSERFLVVFAVSYPPEDAPSVEDAAAAALALTRDGGSASTHWWVYDRHTGEGVTLVQGDFEDRPVH